MGPFQKLRYKTRVGLLLGILMGFLLLNSIASRDSISRMERTANAVYEDRLMPATFVFDIREHLDQERALSAAPNQSAEILRERRVHKSAIAELISRYENTVLTAEERAEWNNFKQHLHQFHAGERGADEHYAQTLKSLNHLSQIQAGEGKHLQSNMHAIVSESALRSHVETGIIIAIGVITLTLIGFSRNTFEQGPPHRPSLN